MCSPFFSNLALRLESVGHKVVKINFNSGDVLYSSRLKSINYVNDIQQLPDFLTSLYLDRGITDQVVFGDRRPIHISAISHSQKYGIRNHVFEEGYFRPSWITLERGGVNARSSLPRDANWFLNEAENLNHSFDAIQSFVSPFRNRAWHDVCYHTANAINPIVFPYYKTHSNVSAPIEYAGYIRRITKMKFNRSSELKKVNNVIEKRIPFYLIPLQLNSDMQVRDHSNLNDMPAFLDYVFKSFSQYAPKNTQLMIKNHPLDIGLIDYQDLISTLEKKYAIEDRTVYMEGGDLNHLVNHALGLITINSTAGLVALEYGCPTLALGDAIYNFAGLTNQTDINHFWTKIHPADATVFNSFKKIVLYATQVNGGFYCPKGIELALQQSCDRLIEEQSRLECLLEAA